MSLASVFLPQMGESVSEGTITKWMKKVGDAVEREELLFEVSTDKVDTEIPSPAAGVLAEILVPAGAVAKIGVEVARIRLAGEQDKCPPVAVSLPPATAPTPMANNSLLASAMSKEVSISSPNGQASEVRERLLASPLARHLAAEVGIDLALVNGSGTSGRIVRGDVEAYQRAQSAQPAAAPMVLSTNFPAVVSGSSATREERVPMTVMRKKIAEHMVLSKRTSPHVTSVVEVNVQKIVDARKKYAAEFEKQQGFKLSYTPFLLAAAIAGLRAVPILNSSIDGDDIIYKKDINLGVAVALETGLIVPVVKHAQDLSFVGIARTLNDLAQRARDKRLSPDDVRGGTFSVTNYGVFGTLIGQPIINQPQVGIMGVGTFEKRPIVIDDAIAIRTMCYVVASYDHRVVDGADGGKFLAAVKAFLENWNMPVV